MKETIHYIYKIVNKLNNKHYIGYTIDPIRRWRTHKNTALTSKPYSISYIHRAMKKHGIDNFEFQIILCSKDQNYTLNEMEKYFIILYNSRKCGYNLTDGGEATTGRIHSEKTKDLIRQKAIGRKRSEACKKKMSEYYKNNPPIRKPESIAKMLKTRKERWRYKPLSEEHRKNISLKLIGKKMSLSDEQRLYRSNVLKANPLMHNPLIREKARRNKIGKGCGARNGRATFCNVFDPELILIASGYLRDICAENNFPFKKFLANSREPLPLQRGEWKGWNIVKIDKIKQPHIKLLKYL